jgi:hypothetical protein
MSNVIFATRATPVLFLMFRFVSLFLMPPVKMGGTLIELKLVPIFDLTP